MPPTEPAFDNRLRRTLARLAHFPPPLRGPLRSLAVGRAIPFVATAGIRIEELTPALCRLRLADRRRVHNHIGGVHAAAMALLAETASGLAFGMHVPDTHLPLLRRMRLDYVARCAGSLLAEAALDAEQQQAVQTEDGGDVAVRVRLRDSAGGEPAICELLWSWRRKRA